MQHYVDPNTVEIGDVILYPSKRRKAFLSENGQIQPLLVHNNNGVLTVADNLHQIETLVALRELKWPTILCEDNWEEEDL